VKHAGESALEGIEPLLLQLRAAEGIVERSRGVFYRRSRAFLHFHEDPTGLYADLRADPDGDFDRFRVNTAAEQASLLREVRRIVGVHRRVTG